MKERLFNLFKREQKPIKHPKIDNLDEVSGVVFPPPNHPGQPTPERSMTRGMHHDRKETT